MRFWDISLHLARTLRSAWQTHLSRMDLAAYDMAALTLSRGPRSHDEVSLRVRPLLPGLGPNPRLRGTRHAVRAGRVAFFFFPFPSKPP